MFRPRVIPTLLLKNNGLVKSIKFKDYRYIGDPINAVHLFNELGVDEISFLDIDATAENRTLNENLIKRIADEANMPFALGGGIRSIDNIRNILKIGGEKVIISSFAIENPDFIKEASKQFGSSTISVCLDVKKNMLGNHKVFINNGKKNTNYDVIEIAKIMESQGAGELIINSIDYDGTMEGFDLNIINKVSKSVQIPVVALGGCGSMEHFKSAVDIGFASAVAAGSFFIYKGSRRGILINYPGSEAFDKLFK